MSWRDELRDNARLRLGLALLAAVLGLYGLIEWQDRQALRAGQLQRMAAQVARLSNPQTMGVWPQRAREARAVLQGLEQRLWRNTSVGLAQAQFQDWLRDQLRLANAPNATVRIAEAEGVAATRPDVAPDPSSASAGAAAGGDLLRVGAQVDFALADPQLLVALLAAMAANQRAVQVESLVVKNQRVEMRVAASFRIGPDQVDADRAFNVRAP